MGRKIDLTGKIFGRLKVISYAETREKKLYWNCLCKCGSEKIICGGSLMAKVSKSCGCLRKQLAKKNSTTHGMSKTKLYKVVFEQKERCQNPHNDSFHKYGGRGIKYNFETIQAGVDYILANLGEKPFKGASIDRKENCGHYEPGNLRWATPKDQVLNRRVSNKKLSPFRGVGKHGNNWRVLFVENGKRINLGTYKEEILAADVYLQKYFEVYKVWPPEYSDVPLCYKSPLIYRGLL